MRARSQPLLSLAVVGGLSATGAAAHAAGEEEAGGGAHCTSQASDYNLPLATASVFIMLFVSFVGALAPLALCRLRHPLVGVGVKVGSFAGSGVILATALVHVLLPAHEALSSPCLPAPWRGFEAWAFCICAATIVLFQVFEYLLDVLLSHYQAQHHHRHQDLGEGGEGHGHAYLAPGQQGQQPQQAQQQRQQQEGWDQHFSHHSHRHCSAQPGCAGEGGQQACHRQQQQQQGGECRKHAGCQDLECGGRPLLGDAENEGDAAGEQQQQQQQQQPMELGRMFSLALAEVAIGLHSIIIGIALGVTPAGQFQTLLIALCFHQSLEGWALGSAVVEAGVKSAKACLLALFYSLTTPTGIAVGIAVRRGFNSNAAATLLAEGILDSICAGVLLYVVLAGPMNATKVYRGWLRQQGWAAHAACFLAFGGGAAAMALIGKWA